MYSFLRSYGKTWEGKKADYRICCSFGNTDNRCIFLVLVAEQLTAENIGVWLMCYFGTCFKVYYNSLTTDASFTIIFWSNIHILQIVYLFTHFFLFQLKLRYLASCECVLKIIKIAFRFLFYLMNSHYCFPKNENFAPKSIIIFLKIKKKIGKNVCSHCSTIILIFRFNPAKLNAYFEWFNLDHH